jgi:hypothetical protein
MSDAIDENPEIVKEAIQEFIFNHSHLVIEQVIEDFDYIKEVVDPNPMKVGGRSW